MNAAGGEKFGRYEIVRHLATGGMAEVWLANVSGPAGFRKKVVIKTLREHLANDRSAVKMFIHEARLAAQLDHPNIVQVFDFGQFLDSYFLSMEYVTGATLRLVHRKLVKERGSLMPAPLVLTTLVDVCEALTHAHGLMDDAGNWLRIVHRDVTPENVMLTHAGITKVLDFGIAKANTSEPTEAGIVKGKYAYMAPEQILGTAVDGRSDLYAVGVMAYELLTGTRPFSQKSPFELMRQVLKDTPAPLRARAPWIPEPLEQIVLRALAKNPDERQQSATELGEALEGVLHEYCDVPSNRAVAGFFRQLFGAAPNQAQDPGVRGPSSPDHEPQPPTERVRSEPELDVGAVSIEVKSVVELADEDCVSVAAEPAESNLSDRLTNLRRPVASDAELEGWGIAQPEVEAEEFDWDAPIGMTGRNIIRLPGPVCEAPAAPPSDPVDVVSDVASEGAVDGPERQDVSPQGSEEPAERSHGWDVAVQRVNHGAPRPNVAKLFDTSPGDSDVSGADPGSGSEQEEHPAGRRSAWDIILETRAKAAGPRDRADSYNDIWTPSRKTTAQDQADVKDADVDAARAFDRGLASYRNEEYGDALQSWELACRLAPTNRTYALNLNKLRVLVERRRR